MTPIIRLRFYVKSSGYYPPSGKTVGSITALGGVYGLTSGVRPAAMDRFGGASSYFVDCEWHPEAGSWSVGECKERGAWYGGLSVAYPAPRTCLLREDR